MRVGCRPVPGPRCTPLRRNKSESCWVVLGRGTRERVRAGLAHSRQNGKRLGRPATATVHANEVRKLCQSGLSKSEVAHRLNIGRTSMRRSLAAQLKKK